jgi:pantoate--beta-alanine ligase
MQRVTSISELHDQLEAARREGLEVAFVPTMGALHDGHLSLIREARRHAPYVVVSIFVNPLQFGAGEDFEKYPRDVDGDSAKLAESGVSVLFTPTVNDLYRGNMNVSERAGQIGDLYEGAARPDHFDGMLTVVAKMLEAVKPKYVVFGAKDAQQVFLVKKMVEQKFADLEVIVAPTVREANGLALSSRNRYLSTEDHKLAEHISAALQIGQATAAKNSSSPQAAIDAARTEMAKAPEAKLDYIALVEADTFEAVTDGFTGRAILLIAAVVGETRLIDNIDITF